MAKMKKQTELSQLGLELSNYTYFNQIPLAEDYMADDFGVYYIGGKNPVLICEPITISSIIRNRSNNIEYTELSFYDYSKDGNPMTVSKMLETPKLYDKEGIVILRGAGFNIVNETKFKEFLATVKANLNIMTARKIETGVSRYYGSTQYGFEIIDGEVNYDNFVGIDSPIIPSKEFEKLDRQLFKKKGTMEGQLEYLSEFLKDSPCKLFIKLSTAAALTGITKMFLINREDMPCPVYNFSAHSSFGKSYLQKIDISIWGDNRSRSPLIQSTGTSDAGARPIKNRLNVITYEDDDWTEFMKNKNAEEGLSDKIYEHTNGTNVAKANANGTLRENTFSWCGAFKSYSEENSMITSIRDGGQARIITFDAEIPENNPLMIYGPISKKNLINKMQSENYGHLGPAFVQALKGKQEEITEAFMDLCGVYSRKLKNNDKVASLYAILELTYKLAYENGIFPESWGPVTTNDMILQYDPSKITSTAEELYEMIRERILSQSLIYIDQDIKMSKEAYDEKAEKNQQIRGRITIKDIGKKRYKIAIVPITIFDRNIADIEKDANLPIKKISTKNWLQAGWLLPTSQGNAQHTCTNITRQFVKGENTAERCYKIVLEDLTPTDEELEEIKKNLEAMKEKELKEREEQGLMNIPDGIDEVI